MLPQALLRPEQERVLRLAALPLPLPVRVLAVPVTWAVRSAKFMSALSTPGVLRRALSMVRTQEAQVAPLMLSCTDCAALVFVSSAVSWSCAGRPSVSSAP